MDGKIRVTNEMDEPLELEPGEFVDLMVEKEEIKLMTSRVKRFYVKSIKDE